MTASELARFLKEEVPRFQARIDGGDMPVDVEDLLSALDAAVGLLREAENALTEVTTHRPEMEVRHFTISHMPGWTGCKVCQTLATLRLVVGDKEL